MSSRKIPAGYYTSAYWKVLSKTLLLDKSVVCEICGRPRWKLISQGKNKGKWRLILHFNVHHKHYKTLGKERREDIMLLCRQCHEICHAAVRTREMCSLYTELAEFVEQRGFQYTP